MTTTTEAQAPSTQESSVDPIPKSNSLIPIESALKESGLLTQSDIDKANIDGAVESPSIPTTEEEKAVTPVVVHQMRGSEDPGRRKAGVTTRIVPRVIGTNLTNVNRANQNVVVDKVPEIKDPLDIKDHHGYTPRMRLWMADPGYPMLLDILSQKRPKGSASELEMIQRYIWTIPGMTEDKYGNCVVDIGENPHGVLWSCHTDTVHNKNESGRQRIAISQDGFLSLARSETASCLGADDGTGVWLCLQMIQHNVPGRYVFHFGEESGCIGSSAIRKNRPEVLEGMRFAIAFDRQGTNDVVISQRGRRCASEAFAASIAEQLPGSYSSHSGVYTDTAEYMDVIPECTNLSVGYYGQHTSNEVQNLPHLYRLRDAMVKIDPSRFVCERDPKAREVSTFRRSGANWGRMQDYYDDIYGIGGSYDNFEGSFQKGTQGGKKSSYAGTEEGPDDTEIERVFGNAVWSPPEHGPSKSNKVRSLLSDDSEDRRIFSNSSGGEDSFLDGDFASDRPQTPHDVRELIRRYPDEVASVIEEMGFGIEDFWPEILSSLGFRKH